MAPGARSRFGAPVLEPEIFRKQMYCIEESICGIVGTLRRPRSDSAPGNCFPLSSLVTPLRGKGAFSLWCRKGKAFCERALALYRQQHGKDKQNIEFAPPPGKRFCGRPCFWLGFFQVSGIFPKCFGCFIPANTTNKNIWIIEILINHFFAIFKVSRPKTSRPRPRRDLQP